MNRAVLSAVSIIIATALLVFAGPAWASTASPSGGLGVIETGIIAVICGLCIFFFLKYDRFAATYGPEVLTTLGILGCFSGITAALFNFDSNDLTRSIPDLLGGVRTAFWASLAGVLGAVILRLRHRFGPPPAQSSDGIKSASLEDVVIAVNAMRNSLSGQEEGSLLTQIKLQRQETNDRLSQLTNSFDKFSEQMVENNQKAIIDALRQVISDFNSKLTEQFGENFKQLNSAVEKLVIWQENYRLELDQIKQYQESTSADMKASAEAFSLIVSRSEQFADTAERLGDLLEALEEQQDIIFEQEETLNEVLLSLKDVTPQFAAKVDQMLSELSAGVQKIQTETGDAARSLANQLQSTNAEMKALLTDTIRDAQNELRTGLTESQATIKESVLALDKALETELNKSLEGLGRQLASLSGQFAKDYSKLVERWQELLRLPDRTAA